MKYDRCLSTGVLLFNLLLLAVGLPITDAVPLFSLESKFEDSLAIPTTEAVDQSNEVCVIGDVVYAVGDSMPPPEPCQRCICAGSSGVACTSIQCPLRPGCRAVLRSDQCCPDFICECTFGDRLYNNGERIPEAGSPCQVCYCRGGSVECAVLECFWRDDCEPHYEPGRCCPKFDHCPPPADSQHSSRPMNSSTPKMAEITPEATVNLPIVTFQQVFPTSTPQPSSTTQESTTVSLVDTTVEQEDTTISEITSTASEHQAASTPTQDGGAITESAVEAPSEPSSAPENMEARVSDSGITTTQEVTTENSTDITIEPEAELLTSTEKPDELLTEEINHEEIPAESITNTATDIPDELKIYNEATTQVQGDATDATLNNDMSVTEIPETTAAPKEETETAVSDNRQDDSDETDINTTEDYSTEIPTTNLPEIDDESKDDSRSATETPEVASKEVETTTFEIPTTTETIYEADASNQKLIESRINQEDAEITTDSASTEPPVQNHDGESILDEIQNDKVLENLETSTQENDVTEQTHTPNKNSGTESPVVETKIGESSDEEIITETFNAETTTENLFDLIATETVTDENTTEEKNLVETSTDKLESNGTPENDVESRTEPEVTTVVAETNTEIESATEGNKAIATDINKSIENTEINSSLISVLRNELVPAVAVENETINTDLVKNISNNMSPANLEENANIKETDNNKPSIIEELAKTIAKADFPFNLAKKLNENNDTTTESNEFLLNEEDFVDPEFGHSIEISPFPRPLQAPATAFNDWRLAAVQDHSEDGLQSWRDEIDLSVDPGAADILLLPWSEQHLRRRRASPVAQYVQNHGRRHN